MIYNYFPYALRETIKAALYNCKHLEEIRVRAEKNIVFCESNNRWFVDCNGKLTNDITKGVKVSQKQLEDIIKYLTQNSVYAMQDEIKKGFITIKDGSRVGICGKCIVRDDKIENIKQVSSINIRIAHEVKDCGLEVYKKVCDRSKNLLIISPPGHGKTTLLRDLIRLTSNNGKNVSVVDERCEIAPIIEGKPIFDVGINTDVLSDSPKDIGINMVLRTMNPQIIAVDEIATKEDFEAVLRATNSGVKIFATFHGNTKQDYYDKINAFGVSKILFDNYIYISKNKLYGRNISYE